jgi:AcrR family transcriptional regulator
MRRRIIDATVSSLFRFGYGATSISVVAKEAGASRSSIGYHFATKADLMVAVRDQVWRDEQAVLDVLMQTKPPRELLAEMPKHLLAAARSPGHIAVSEILLAARGDPELQEKLKASTREIDKQIMARQPALFAGADIALPDNFLTILHLTNATVQGLVLAELAQGTEAETGACINLYTALMNRLLNLPA